MSHMGIAKVADIVNVNPTVCNVAVARLVQGVGATLVALDTLTNRNITIFHDVTAPIPQDAKAAWVFTGGTFFKYHMAKPMACIYVDAQGKLGILADAADVPKIKEYIESEYKKASIEYALMKHYGAQNVQRHLMEEGRSRLLAAHSTY